MQTEPPSSEDEAGGHLAFRSEGPYVGDRVQCTQRLNPVLVSGDGGNPWPLVQGKVVGYLPANEAEGSSEALYQVKFDEGLLSWRGKVKVIREGKLIHIMGCSMLSLDEAGNIIPSKKKKRDEQSSDDDEDDDDQASAILDRDGVSRTRTRKMIEHGIRIIIKGEGDADDTILIAKDSADGVRKLSAKGISISAPTVRSRVQRIIKGKPCKNWYYLPPPDGRKLVFKQIRGDPTDDTDTDSDVEDNKRIKRGIRIKIKGEGDEEDIILTAKDKADAQRKLEEEQGISIGYNTIKSRLDGVDGNGKPCKNFYECPHSLKKIVFKEIGIILQMRLKPTPIRKMIKTSSTMVSHNSFLMMMRKKCPSRNDY